MSPKVKQAAQASSQRREPSEHEQLLSELKRKNHKKHTRAVPRREFVINKVRPLEWPTANPFTLLRRGITKWRKNHVIPKEIQRFICKLSRDEQITPADLRRFLKLAYKAERANNHRELYQKTMPQWKDFLENLKQQWMLRIAKKRRRGRRSRSQRTSSARVGMFGDMTSRWHQVGVMPRNSSASSPSPQSVNRHR